MRLQLLLILPVIGIFLVAGCVANQTAPTTQQPKTKQIAVDSYNPRAVSIRNVGNETIQAAEIAVYANGELKQCDWDSETMPPYAVRRCSFSGDCMGGQTMLIMGPDNLVQIRC